ncbi:nucleolin-like [Pungitius pungitius]|uniref:nucleolin-like n=1 Tax=Pungitius pungitius TaxID=134920 RepID=UPI002E10422B
MECPTQHWPLADDHGVLPNSSDEVSELDIYAMVEVEFLPQAFSGDNKEEEEDEEEDEEEEDDDESNGWSDGGMDWEEEEEEEDDDESNGWSDGGIDWEEEEEDHEEDPLTQTWPPQSFMTELRRVLSHPLPSDVERPASVGKLFPRAFSDEEDDEDHEDDPLTQTWPPQSFMTELRGTFGFCG